MLGFVLCCAAAPAAAQHTFYKILPSKSGFNDILESNKDGFIATNRGGTYLLSNQGEYLSYIKQRRFNILEKFNNTNEYLMVGVNSNAGEYYFAKTNAEWIPTAESYENLNNIGDSCHIVYNVFIDTLHRKIISSGVHYPNCSKSNDFYPWAALLDFDLKLIKQKQIRTSSLKTGELTQILPNHKTGGYVAVYKTWEKGNQTEIIWLDSNLNTISTSPIETDSCFNPGFSGFTQMVLHDDSIYTIYGTSHFNSTGGCSFYIGTYLYNFNQYGKLISRIPQKTSYSNIYTTPNGKGLLCLGLDTLTLLNSQYDLVWEHQLFKPGNYAYDYFIIKPSIYGGYYGLFSATNSNEYYMHLFRLDSLGNYTNEPEYSEWQQPLMLLPNPAKDKVRVMIPYYLGMVETRIYDMQGRLMLQKTHDEKEYLDLVNFPPGTYVVKSTDLKRGKTRRMKLVVE